MRAKDLSTLLRYHLRSGSGKGEMGSLFVEGAPGLGKSEIITQAARHEELAIAKAAGVKKLDEVPVGSLVGVVDYRLLLRDPTDLRGIPFPNLEAKTSEWLSPGELPGPKTGHPEKGILFFDDMTTAPQLVQAAAYQLTISPHRIGEYQLPEGWVIVAAGNRASDRAAVHPMPKPLQNRFMHIEMEINLEDWTTWATETGVNPYVIGFLQSPAADSSDPKYPHLIFQFDPSNAEKAFPTPRTWAKVSQILSMEMPEHIEAEAIQGTIGNAAAAQFSTFMRLFERLPDPDEILVKKNYKVTPEAIDLRYAMVVSVAQRAKEEQYDNVIGWTDHLPPEFAVLLMKIIAGRDKGHTLMKCKSFPKWALENKDVLLGV